MPVNWVFNTWSNQIEIKLPMIRQVETWMKCIYYTFPPMNPVDDLNMNIIPVTQKHSLLLNWFQPYQTPMLKNADYVKKQHIFFVPVYCNYIPSNYLVGLNYRKLLFRTFCWSSYEDEVLYQLFEVQTDRPGYFVTSISIN